MINRIAPALFAAAGLLGVGNLPCEAQQPQPLYLRTRKAFPAPKLDAVNTREFKHLFDPAKTKPTPEAAFADLWTQIKAAAAKQGFTVTEKEKNPLNVEYSTKEYLDTPDQALWKKGYLIRITTKIKGGKPEASGKVTIKAIHEDPLKTLAVPLEVVEAKAEGECQDNVGLGYKGQLTGYVEKGVSYAIALDTLGAKTLGDFGKHMPELLKLGLAANTALVSTKAWSCRVRPGAVVLPGTDPCGISMEGWSATEGGQPYLYDFSYAFEEVPFYGNDDIHAAGEAFVLKVLHTGLSHLNFADGEKWGGSKVRKLMNRPLPR